MDIGSVEPDHGPARDIRQVRDAEHAREHGCFEVGGADLTDAVVDAMGTPTQRSARRRISDRHAGCAAQRSTKVARPKIR
jgi:hypothetical protein